MKPTKQSHFVMRQEIATLRLWRGLPSVIYFVRLAITLIGFVLILAFLLLPVNAQNNVTVPTAGVISYNIQKYTGFNFIVNYFAKTVIKAVLKLKTKAKKVSVKLEIFSGLDLIKKKAKYLSIRAEELVVKKIPVSYFEVTTEGPIYFTVLPLNINVNLQVKLNNVIEVLNGLSDHNSLGEIDLPIPPFGSAKVKLSDFNITVDDNGFVQADAVLKSAVNPDSEPLKLRFSGDLLLSDKKIIINNLKSEVEDIFTKDSDIGKSFSEMLEDLINPVINFHKYEKNGLTIDNVYLFFESNNLVLKIKSRLLPNENEVQ